MNPHFRKVYNALCESSFNLLQLPQQIRVLKSASEYSSYAWYLATTHAPRLSHYEIYTDAYTPARTKYNMHLVLGFIGFFTVYEMMRFKKCQMANCKDQKCGPGKWNRNTKQQIKKSSKKAQQRLRENDQI